MPRGFRGGGGDGRAIPGSTLGIADPRVARHRRYSAVDGQDARPTLRNSRDVLRYAFSTDIRAAYSTIDIGGILSNVANKFLLEGFFSVERTWRNITAVRNVSDFKTVTSYRLIGRDQYEEVAPGGELKHGTLGEGSYTNKADTYGLLLSIDRRERELAERREGPPGFRRSALADLEDRLQTVASAATKIRVIGTCSPAALFGLGGSSPIERTARATEQTAKNTQRLVEAARNGGLRFT